jgi:hypothetical protein
MLVLNWTLPRLVDRKISGKYNGEGAKDGKANERAASIHGGI